MRQTLQLVLYVAVATVLAAGCTGKRSQTAKESDRQAPATDTTYTQQAAMAVYGYQPERALQIIDTAVIVGNLSEVWVDHWNNDARIWMCDRFSLNLVNCLTDNPQSNFRDIFLYCAQHTLGSHAKIVNAANYGNLFTTFAEFILYNK